MRAATSSREQFRSIRLDEPESKLDDRSLRNVLSEYEH
ncbi:hypothetical protein BN1263200065 [Stenotrophomonas maltophilia]|nr:hypothetical protein BN1263200065 [Stenotrophomonas maltophilia]